MKLTSEAIERVARLARCRLEGQALERLVAQLDKILHYVEHLDGVPTDGVVPTSHVLPLSNVLREDTLRPCLDPDTVVLLAPVKHPPFVGVPKVLGHG